MSHFALVTNGIVEQVIVAEQDFIDLLPNKDSWIQTSYNTKGNQHAQGGIPLRGNYAGIGYTYDAINDVFYGQQPFASWTLNQSTWIWEAPTPMPTDGVYIWDEEQLKWVKYD
jgi:hypothetical protein